MMVNFQDLLKYVKIRNSSTAIEENLERVIGCRALAGAYGG